MKIPSVFVCSRIDLEAGSEIVSYAASLGVLCGHNFELEIGAMLDLVTGRGCRV